MAAVATPHRWASGVARAVLDDGGGAVDAALAAAAALVVAYPQHTGVGGDGFWLVRRRGEPTVALNASGRAPAAADAEWLRRSGHDEVPERSAWAVTVPGMVDGWRAVHERFGRRPLEDLLAPAAEAAERGVVVTEILARAFAGAAGVLGRRPESRRVFGAVGDRLVQPDLAATLRALAAEPRALYDGPLAQAVADAVQAEGGWLSAEDLAEHESEWVEPVAAGFAGWTVEELPPNSQGVTALIGLRRIERDGLPAAGDAAAWLARSVEAARFALAVRDAEVADPSVMRRRPDELPALGEVRPTAPLRDGGGDTVHLAVVDDEGTAVSCIQSLFDDFGSGIVVPGTGITLHNRGCGFSLDPARLQHLAPRLRPLHTLAPAMATTATGETVAFGCMGGHAQAQIHVQLVTAMAGEGLDPVSAVRRPRWLWQGGELLAEDRDGLPDRLRRLGHDVRAIEPFDQLAGHAQVVAGATAAADPRSDGVPA